MGAPTEEKRAELDEFISHASLVIGTMGFRVFKPVDDARRSGACENPPEKDDEPLLFFTTGNTSASGRRVSDGFVVLAGSRLRPESQFPTSAPERARFLRELYADRINSDLVLMKDTQFSSPSTAGTFVAGASVNGRVAWKTKSGQSLKQLEESEIERK